MSKPSPVMIAAFCVLLALFIYQHEVLNQMRTRVAAAEAENARLRQATSLATDTRDELSESTPPEPAVADLQTQEKFQPELLRLRNLASRTIRAEEELATLKSKEASPAALRSPVAIQDPVSTSLAAYLGDPVPVPPNLAPAYDKEGLIKAIQQAALTTGAAVKSIAVDNSEFPFLLAVATESEGDFEKIKAQLKLSGVYDYGGSVGSSDKFTFNITPSRVYAPGSYTRISNRLVVRQKQFFDSVFTPGPPTSGQ